MFSSALGGVVKSEVAVGCNLRLWGMIKALARPLPEK